MKQAKIGDVYYVKLPNGYKLYQWAYTIPRRGDYIRVFGGLYDAVPEDVASIVSHQHSYIISFNAGRAYRIRLAHLIDNFPVPDEYPFPEYMIGFIPTTKIDGIEVMRTDGTLDEWKWYHVSRLSDLPAKYQNITMINGCVTPTWLLYLFDTDFDLSKLEKFSLASVSEQHLQIYSDMVEEALAKSRTKRKKT